MHSYIHTHRFTYHHVRIFFIFISFRGARFCQVYQGGSILCDYNSGKNISVYIKSTQSYLTLKLNKVISVLLDATSNRCQDLIRRVLCLYYYTPCGINGTLTAPVSICPEECFYVKNECLEVWNDLETLLLETNLGFINCSSPGQELDYLHHCCVDAGITSSSTPGQTQLQYACVQVAKFA